MRQYPAYGRAIAGQIVRGIKPIAVAVLLSSRWNYLNHAPKVGLRPDEWARGRYEFGFLRGMRVVLVLGDGAEPLHIAELVLELMRAAPIYLWAYDVAGTKLYDGEYASDLTWWVRELAVQAGCGDKLPWAEIRSAVRVMEEAQARDARAFVTKSEAIKQRDGEEEWFKWALAVHEIPGQVRAMFGQGDAQPA